MEFVDNCLILRTGKFRESDLWLRLLSPRYGIFRAFAFGGCKSRRRFCGCLDTLNHVRFRVQYSSRREYYTLQEGTLIRGFAELKQNNSKIGMAANCLRFMDSLQIFREDAPQVHEIMVSSFAALEEENSPDSFFPLVFKAALVFSLGFRPDMAGCAGCGLPLEKIDRPGFDVLAGRVFCSACAGKRQGMVYARGDALRFLHRLQKTGPREWVRWNPGKRVRQDCLQLVDSFVRHHLQGEIT